MSSCWTFNQGAIHEQPAWRTFANDGSNDCCQTGDIPLDLHICYSTRKNQLVDYYPAGTSDKNCLVRNDTLSNVQCPQRTWCPDEQQPAVITYLNDASHTWQCCGRGNTGGQSCNPASGNKFVGPLAQSDYDNVINNVHKLGIAAIVGIAIAGFAFLVFWGVVIFCCCCSPRARERRSRGKFVPIGSGRDMPGDNVVWNSNVHDGNELHDGPMGGYAAPPPGPGPHGAPQYTVQGFR